MVISAGLDTDKLPKALRLIMRELRRLAETPVSKAELQRARDYILGQLELSQESTESQMNWVGEQLLGYGKVIPPAEVKRHLSRVTAAEIRAAARDIFGPDRVNLALVSPLKSPKGLSEILRGAN